MFPLQAAYYCRSLPHVDSSPALGVLWIDPTPYMPSAILFSDWYGLPLTLQLSPAQMCVNRRKRRVLCFGTTSITLSGAYRASQVLRLFSSYMPCSLTPTDPPESRLYRFLRFGFRSVNNVAICSLLLAL